ncbi:MAG: hypothetical protein AAF414_15890 [Pseudomonadota bacterium]
MDDAASRVTAEDCQRLMKLVGEIARACKQAHDRALPDEDADLSVPPDHLASTLALRVLAMIPRDLGGMK